MPELDDDLVTCWRHQEPWYMVNGENIHKLPTGGKCRQPVVFSDMFWRSTGSDPARNYTPAEPAAISAWLRQFCNVERWEQLSPETMLFLIRDIQVRGFP